MGNGRLGGLWKEPTETQHSVVAFMFCSCWVSRPVTKEETEARGSSWSSARGLSAASFPPGQGRGGIIWNSAGALPSPALPRGIPAFFPSVLLKPWAVFMTVCFHVLKEWHIQRCHLLSPVGHWISAILCPSGRHGHASPGLEPPVCTCTGRGRNETVSVASGRIGGQERLGRRHHYSCMNCFQTSLKSQKPRPSFSQMCDA